MIIFRTVSYTSTHFQCKKRLSLQTDEGVAVIICSAVKYQCEKLVLQEVTGKPVFLANLRL